MVPASRNSLINTDIETSPGGGVAEDMKLREDFDLQYSFDHSHFAPTDKGLASRAVYPEDPRRLLSY